MRIISEERRREIGRAAVVLAIAAPVGAMVYGLGASADGTPMVAVPVLILLVCLLVTLVVGMVLGYVVAASGYRPARGMVERYSTTRPAPAPAAEAADDGGGAAEGPGVGADDLADDLYVDFKDDGAASGAPASDGR